MLSNRKHFRKFVSTIVVIALLYACLFPSSEVLAANSSIFVSSNRVVMEDGEYDYELKITALNDEEVNYEIENPEIIDCEWHEDWEGDSRYLYLTALSEGNTKLTICGNDTKEKEIIEVTVISCQQKLNYSNKSIYVGSSFRLDVDGYIGSVKWTTSNKSIATVNSNGTVKGKRKGIVTITASFDGKKLSCKVSVKNPIISEKRTKASVGDTIRFLSVEGGSGKITWQSSNKKIAVVNSKGQIKILKPGKVTITAKRNGVKMTCKVTAVSKNSMAKQAYKKLMNVLKYPSTARIIGITHGTTTGRMLYHKRKVIMIEYSAMNDYGIRGYNCFMGWYSNDGEFCYSVGHYYPGDLVEKVQIPIRVVR